MRRSLVSADLTPLPSDGRTASRGTAGSLYPSRCRDRIGQGARLTGQWSGLKAIVDWGRDAARARRSRATCSCLAFLPIGARGGRRVDRRGVRWSRRGDQHWGSCACRWERPAKVLAMLGVTVLSAALSRRRERSPSGNAIAPVQTLDVGICVNGVAEGSVIDADRSRVPAVTPHDNEVVGHRDVRSESSAYPGQADARDVRGTGLHRGDSTHTSGATSRARASTCCRSCRRMRPGPRATARSPASCWPGTVAS